MCVLYMWVFKIFFSSSFLIHAALLGSLQIIKQQQGLIETSGGFSRVLLFAFYLAACSRQKKAVAQQLPHLSRSGFTTDKRLLNWMAAIVLSSGEDFSLTCISPCRAMRLKMYDLLC